MWKSEEHVLSGHLLKLIVQRILLGIVTLFVISMLIFLGTEFLPGDVAQTILGQAATPENLAALRAELGLDRPPLTRYVEWLGGILQGDLGTSLSGRRDIAEMIGSRLGNTMYLAAVSAIVSIPLAILLGLIAVRFRDTWIDKFISITTLTTISLPEFFVAYILILVFSVKMMFWNPSLMLPSLSNVYDGMTFGARLQAIAFSGASDVVSRTHDTFQRFFELASTRSIPRPWR